MVDNKKSALAARYRDRRAAKKAKIDARWAPYATKRATVEHRAASFVSDAAGDYRFYTALCFAMALAGFFFLHLMEVVALVGGLAMWQHWGRAIGTPEQFAIPAFGFWRALSLVTIFVAAAGCAFMLFTVANEIMVDGWTGLLR